jgi:anti-anti-sigma factor
VRGQDGLLERLGPLVREHSVALDLTSVERIDAAGITALVALYRGARESGHRFSLTNVSARVAQILAVGGLDRFLLSHNAVRNSQCGPRMRARSLNSGQRSANSALAAVESSQIAEISTDEAVQASGQMNGL